MVEKSEFLLRLSIPDVWRHKNKEQPKQEEAEDDEWKNKLH